MVSISDEFQTYFGCKPTLFGTILKTTRLHYSKVTQSDCMFDVYARIIGQYRKRFSSPSDCMNDQRCKNQSNPKYICSPCEANCSLILYVSFFTLCLSATENLVALIYHKCAQVSVRCSIILSLDHFQKCVPCSRNVTNFVVCLQTNTVASKITIFFDARAFRPGIGSNP
jgi:hypothetical protein